MLIRMVKFCRSTKLVETCSGSGWPMIVVLRVPMQTGGL